MVAPIDIEISAKVMIGEFGNRACAIALKRAAELALSGDAEGAAVFEKIASSIRRYQNVANDHE